ncbi:uncharacterized protein LOC126409871 [Nymphaea colorata]|uniref:uncharacterized protein LOC126409871 n=1 Tax=Nymphaea colorata TaxID=210225 RepID=UPI00214E730D|nr:uncharacterized protein LOC126409871 [Nymphaea colorata]
MAVSSFMAPKRENPSASSITRKEMSPLRQADASVASDEKMEWSHFIGVGGKGLSAISILTPGCSNSNQPFGEVGSFLSERRTEGEETEKEEKIQKISLWAISEFDSWFTLLCDIEVQTCVWIQQLSASVSIVRIFLLSYYCLLASNLVMKPINVVKWDEAKGSVELVK